MSSRTSKPKEKIYDDIAYTYKDLNDVQYKLEASELRTMQKMEHALGFILQNLDKPVITAATCAKVAGYEEAYFIRAFRKYFDIPFSRFVTKLKLRQAAREIRNDNYPDSVGKKYGFSTVQSFSKAFRNEFGISPRTFYKNSYDAPDMPLRSRVMDMRFDMEYRRENALYIEGVGLPPHRGDKTYYMDATAFVYSDKYHAPKGKVIDLSADNDKVGIWWYEQDAGMEYVFGDVLIRFDSPYVKEVPQKYDASKQGILIQGGNYAVFSFDRPEDNSKIELYSRMLSRYIFKEWVVMNGKVTDTMGYTYQLFTKEKVYFYLPLSSGMYIDEVLHLHDWGIGEWANYIDENITSDLTTESLARLSGYSPQNYRDVFEMYYGITPAEYVKKRRTYLAYTEMEAGADEKITLEKYRFSSRNIYEKAAGELATTGNDIKNKDEFDFKNLMQYYKANKSRVKMGFCHQKRMNILMHSIEESNDAEVPNDITERMIYWFRHEFNDFVPVKNHFKQPYEKVFVWGEEALLEEDQKTYKYYVGSVIDGNQTTKEIDELRESTSARIEIIEGGRYAVFSTFDSTDERSPSESLHLLMVCAFGGYIHENRWRIDMKRRTFIIWRNRKLYFYVPVIH